MVVGKNKRISKGKKSGKKKACSNPPHLYASAKVFILKVMILKAPKFDLGKLMEVHGDYSEDVGVKLERPAEEPVAEPMVGA